VWENLTGSFSSGVCVCVCVCVRVCVHCWVSFAKSCSRWESFDNSCFLLVGCWVCVCSQRARSCCGWLVVWVDGASMKHMFKKHMYLTQQIQFMKFFSFFFSSLDQGGEALMLSGPGPSKEPQIVRHAWVTNGKFTRKTGRRLRNVSRLWRCADKKSAMLKRVVADSVFYIFFYQTQRARWHQVEPRVTDRTRFTHPLLFLLMENN